MIEIRNLSVQFRGGVTAIDRLDLTVPEKENTVIIGESGSGKSVLLAAILRILPATARVSGELRLDRTDLLSLSDKEMNALRGTQLAYIPQGGGSSMNPLLTVGYQIAEPLMEKKAVPVKTALSAAVDWMKRLNLGSEEKLAAAYPHTLSGGMRQRALIAMGAITGAPVLLADEPTTGLDGERVETVTDLLLRLKDRTILCVSHDLRFARIIADRICVMYAAHAVEQCRGEDFFAGPLHPYSRMILEAMPDNGLKADMGFAPPHSETGTMGCRFYDRCPRRGKRCLQPPPMAERAGRKVRCWLYAD